MIGNEILSKIKFDADSDPTLKTLVEGNKKLQNVSFKPIENPS